VLAWYCINSRVSIRKVAALAPVIVGVGLATYGDYNFSLWGFLLTLSGASLAALKTVVTHILQTDKTASGPGLLRHRPLLRLKLLGVSITIPHPPQPRFGGLNLHPLDLLTRMSPLACMQCIAYAHISGELDALRRSSIEGLSVCSHFWIYPAVLAINGMIAFGLNVVSFEANRRTSALAMGVICRLT
jgi:hypothetical protein